jgi:nicotinamide/nicotinate riboside kinase
LPPRFKSKEDLNEVTDSGVDDATVARIRAHAAERLKQILKLIEDRNIDNNQSKQLLLSLAFVEGFLLYAPPNSPSHVLRPVHDKIEVPLFLPATYTLVKARREGRTGYVTIGPAPAPIMNSDGTRAGEPLGENPLEGQGDDDEPRQNFWDDPPGYVDDIVWPCYITNHAWLLLSPDSPPPASNDQLSDIVGEGKDVRGDVGVRVAPGRGEAPMAQLLEWAVNEVLKSVENQMQDPNLVGDRR